MSCPRIQILYRFAGIAVKEERERLTLSSFSSRVSLRIIDRGDRVYEGSARIPEITGCQSCRRKRAVIPASRLQGGANWLTALWPFLPGMYPYPLLRHLSAIVGQYVISMNISFFFMLFLKRESSR